MNPNKTYRIFLVYLGVGCFGLAFAFWPSLMSAQSGASDALRVEARQSGAQVEFYAQNTKAYDVTIDIRVGLTNMSSSRRVPFTQTIRGNTSQKVFVIQQKTRDESFGFNYEYQWTRGDVDAEHEDDHVYRLPYENGRAFRVVQGYGGETSHKKGSKYAIDFGMPEGTPIVAARAGEVVGVYEKSNSGGPSRKYAHLGNHVIIRHADRTLGEYLHLRQWGAVVEVGDEVAEGQVIGYSGNTGFSTGPHLHFGVYSAKDGRTRKSHAVRLEHADGIVRSPEPGRAYVAH